MLANVCLLREDHNLLNFITCLCSLKKKKSSCLTKATSFCNNTLAVGRMFLFCAFFFFLYCLLWILWDFILYPCSLKSCSWYIFYGYKGGRRNAETSKVFFRSVWSVGSEFVISAPDSYCCAIDEFSSFLCFREVFLPKYFAVLHSRTIFLTTLLVWSILPILLCYQFCSSLSYNWVRWFSVLRMK